MKRAWMAAIFVIALPFIVGAGAADDKNWAERAARIFRDAWVDAPDSRWEEIIAAPDAAPPPETRSADAGPARVDNHGLDPGKAASILEFAKKVMAVQRVPGLAIGVVSGSTTSLEAYLGWANLERKRPIGPDTVFRVGSISKLFTAAGLMQQWEAGKFGLDDDVNRYVPTPLVKQSQRGCAPVTFKALLTHTGGGGEFKSYRHRLGPDNGKIFFPAGPPYPPLTSFFKDPLRPRVCPGSKWAYCNFCFGGLGYVLEQLSGQSFEVYTRQRVLDPIGMTDSAFHETTKILDQLATGYYLDPRDQTFKPVPLRVCALTPMGNLFSTPADLADFLAALLGGGKNRHGRLLKEETLKEMLKTQYTLDDRQRSMGLAFFIESATLGTPVFSHGGDLPGFSAALFVAPEKKVGVFVLANKMGPAAHAVAKRAIKVLIGHSPPGAPPPPDRAHWKDLIGSYGSGDPDYLSDYRFLVASGGAFTVSEENDELFINAQFWPKPVRLQQLQAEDPNFFRFDLERPEFPYYLTFVPGPDGRAASIVMDLNQYQRLSQAELLKVKLKIMALLDLALL